MRTSQLTGIALVLTLIVATTSLADTYVVAQADAYYTFDYDYDEGGFDISVWEAGYYDWSYYLFAYARVYVRGNDGSGSSAYADAAAAVSGAANKTVDAVASVSGSLDEDTDSEDHSDNDTVYMPGAGVVLTFDDEAWADATCGHPSVQAYAKATTTTSGSVE